MNWEYVHRVWALVWCPRKLRLGAQTLCITLLLLAATTHPARADCPAAPIADSDDMAISFLAANGVQAASASLLASSIKEGIVVYDDANDVLKLCDGTNWIDVGSGSGTDTLASLSCSAGQIAKYNGTAWACAADGGGSGTPTGFYATRTSNLASNNTVTFDSEAFDSTNSFDAATGVFTAPATGIYQFIWGSLGNQTNDVYRLYLRRNGVAAPVPHSRADSNATGSEYIQSNLTAYLSLTAGDTVSVFYQSDGGNALLSDASRWIYFGGNLVSGGGSDTLAGLSCATNEIPKWNGTAWACAVDGGGSGAGTSAPGPYLRLSYSANALDRQNIIPFNVAESGGGASWASNRFTAVIPGLYLTTVDGFALGATYIGFSIRKNGSAFASGYGDATQTTKSGGSGVTAVTYLNAGDYIDFWYTHDSPGIFLNTATASIAYVGGGGSGSTAFMDGVVIESQTSSSITSACPTYVDVPGSSKSITIPSDGDALVNFSQVFYTDSGGVRYRFCVDASCTTGLNYYSNEASSHKTAAGSWVVPVTSGTRTGKLQYCKTAGTTVYQNGSGSMSWSITMPGGGGSDTLAGLSCSAGQVPEWDGSDWVCGTGAGESSGNVVTGSYTGNGAASQSINLGFRPKLVVVKGINGTYKPVGIAIDGIPDGAAHSRIYASNGVAADSTQPKITATGFDAYGNTNDSTFNYSGTVYHYTAIKDGGGSATAAGSVAGAVQFNDGSDAFAADDVNLVWDNTNKRLGIGTATPAYKLSVAGNGAVALSVDSNDATTTSYAHIQSQTDAGRVVLFHNSSGRTATRWGLSSLGGWGEIAAFASLIGAGELQGLVVGVHTDKPLVFGTNNTERMRIDANGSVGIGTATPTSKLTIQEGTLALNSTGSNVGISFAPQDSTATYSNTADERFFRFGPTAMSGGSDTSFGYKFSWRNADGSPRINTLLFHKDGSVSIGGGYVPASALLDLTSTTKGFLPPRMTTAQRDAIASPAEGLVVYNTTTKSIDLRVASSWLSFGGTMTGNTMVSGWPDAIRCDDADTDDSTYVLGQHLYANKAYYYRVGVTNSWIAFNNPGGTWNSRAGTEAADCVGQSIAQLYTAGKAFNFVGGATATADGTSGQVQFNEGGNLKADAALHWDNTNKRLGIGTATPAFPLHVASDATAVVAISQASGNAQPPILGFRKSRGTHASPAAASVDDPAGQIDFNAYNDAFRSVASIAAYADTGFGAAGTDTPGRLVLSTTPDGSSVPSPRLAILSNGNVGIGTASPGATLDIHTAGASLWVGQATSPNPRLELIDTGSYGRLQSYNGSLAINPLGNYVGIGTATPITTLDVVGNIQTTREATYGHLGQYTYSDTAGHYSGVIGYRARGTKASPAHVQSGDNMASFHGRDAINNAWAGMSVTASEAHSSTAGGAQISFHTTLNGTLSSTQKMIIDNAGNVGIGTTTVPQKLTVFGNIRVGTSGTNGCLQQFAGAALAGTCASDERLKKNIVSLDDAHVLDRLTLITPSTYEWRHDEYPERKLGSGPQLGVIAQQVEENFPELVETGEDGFKMVKFSEMNIYMLQAIRELKQRHDALVHETRGLKADNDNLRDELKAANDNYQDLRREIEALRASRP